jgi:RNA polymerase sigma factor for flagellar operon FliA
MPTMPPTVPPPRAGAAADTAEVLARFHTELDLVDLNARQIARRLAATNITLDDLRSFGREGLLQAARSFDPARGVPFRRWANLRIRGSVIDGVRQWGHLPRRVYAELRSLAAANHVEGAYEEEHGAPPATPEAADARLTSYLAAMATAMAVGAATVRDDLASDENVDTPEELTATAELLQLVKTIVKTLPDAERTLIERHYFGDDTLEEAAASLGLSKSWGSRLHARAIERIAKELRELR